MSRLMVGSLVARISYTARCPQRSQACPLGSTSSSRCREWSALARQKTTTFVLQRPARLKGTRWPLTAYRLDPVFTPGGPASGGCGHFSFTQGPPVLTRGLPACDYYNFYSRCKTNLPDETKPRPHGPILSLPFTNNCSAGSCIFQRIILNGGRTY